MSILTPLHDLHIAQGGKLVDFHGWRLPIQFDGILNEHRHCRRDAVLFDTCHMGLLAFRGPEAGVGLGMLTTQNPLILKPGRCRYGFLLNAEGDVLDDTILMRLGEAEFLLVVNAGTQGDDFAWLDARLPPSVERTNLSAQGWGKVDLQGPASFDVLQPLVDVDLREQSYFSIFHARFQGQDCAISRTGYTGELGYEIMAPGETIAAIAEQLLDAPVVKPAGLGARDSLRLEMGYPLYGQDLDPFRTPVEAAMDRFLVLDHDFVGRRSIEARMRDGVAEQLVLMRCDSRRRPHNGDPILADGQPAGAITSGAFAPSLEVSIAMGYVATELARPGQALTIAVGTAQVGATVVEKPLYKQGTCAVKLKNG